MCVEVKLQQVLRAFFCPIRASFGLSNPKLKFDTATTCAKTLGLCFQLFKCPVP